MAAHYDEAHNLIISDDDARGGVTGHNVRYVLVFGMTGVIAAFAGIALYAGYDSVHERLVAALSQSPSELMKAFAPYAAIVLFGAIVTGLLLGIWSMIAGRSDSGSQSLMRLRVAGQFAIICMIMAMLYLSRAA